MKEPSEIGIGLLGMGVVGGSVVEALLRNRGRIASQVGKPIDLKAVLVRDLNKPRSFQASPGILTTDASDILENPDIDIVVELMGGERPASDYIKRAVSLGKHVVTANKEVMAKEGPEILALAQEREVRVLFEASVGGGIPIIAPLVRDLTANDILTIRGIINGTTNYILTKMSKEGLDFAKALAQAQELGYAEADPSNDVEGVDAAYKLSILSTLGFHMRVRPSDVYYEGITHLTASDFRYAQELGYTIKLMAIGHKEEGHIQVRVHPAFVPQDVIMAKVDGAFNGVEITADMVGRVFFHGMGAGPLPTSSAVMADVIEIARGILNGDASAFPLMLDDSLTIRPMSELQTKYYIRLTLTDRPGVFAKIGIVLGDLDISIASVIQKEVDEESQTAEVVIMTHPAKEAAVQRALQGMKDLDVVREIGNMIRVEEWLS